MSRRPDKVLACDLGGTNFRAALADRAGKLSRLSYGKIPDPATPRAVLAMMIAVCRSTLQGAPRPRRFGLSMKGLVDPENGLSIKVSDFKAWKNVPVVARLSAAFGVPGRIENDAKCAALGEGWLGQARGATDFVFVIVGTGIGTGIVQGGKLVRGYAGHAGELGHTMIALGEKDLRCGCGQYGDLESMAAGPSLAARARLRLNAGDRGLARFLARRGGEVDGVFVSQALKAGVPAARAIVTEAATYLGVGLYNIVRALDPERIVIGGGVSCIGEPFLGPARQVCARRLALFDLKPPRILRSSLGDDAGLLGAASLAWRD